MLQRHLCRVVSCRAVQVGCMIGFYVVTCDRDREAKFNDGRGGMIGETAFVPMHQGAAASASSLVVASQGREAVGAATPCCRVVCVQWPRRSRSPSTR